ncbi:MAG: TMEM175 family protein [Solirubrobacteraceae bacterium]
MSTNRLESFSDAVIAVAVTLLVLDIKVPSPAPDQSLGHELLKQWPTYAAYATSFITIGIIWINHHAMIGRLARADHSILILNLLLLLSIGVLPFGTSLIATYLREGHGQNLAAAIYAGLFLVMSIAFATLNRHILFRKTHLTRDPLPLERRREILSRGIAGLAPYAIATAVAALSPDLTLIICAAIAVFYALPVASGEGFGGET